MNEKVREVVEFENHFSEFLKKQPEKVQNKIFKIIEAIETLERIPSNYLKMLFGTNGLYDWQWKTGCFVEWIHKNPEKWNWKSTPIDAEVLQN